MENENNNQPKINKLIIFIIILLVITALFFINKTVDETTIETQKTLHKQEMTRKQVFCKKDVINDYRNASEKYCIRTTGKPYCKVPSEIQAKFDIEKQKAEQECNTKYKVEI